MRKLSDYQNEEAIDLLADILEPTARILADKELESLVKSNGTKIGAVKVALKNNKESVLEILARLEGVPREEYTCNVAQVLTNVMELLNDKELVDFFVSQKQTAAKKPSSSATANTKAKKQ